MSNRIYHINNDIKHTLIQTFSIDHNLTNSELIDLEENANLYKEVNHIYFKDNIDIDSINNVKSILESSSVVDDSKIEKYILIDYSKDDLRKILDINYKNPTTWKVYYLRTDGVKDIYSVVEARELFDYFDKLKKEYDLDSFSIIEKICLIYDKVKLLDYKDVKNTLLEIINSGETNSYGYNLLFQELLNILEISLYIEEVKEKEKRRFISVVNINDDKYNIDGIYLFDPFMDSLSKKEYDNDLRRINYNYFLLSIDNFYNMIYKDSLSGILNIFYMPKEDMFKDHLEEVKLFDEKDIEKFIEVFGDDYLKIYETIKNTKEIDSNTLFSIIENTLKKEKYLNIDNMDIIDLIKKNYIIKYNEMHEKF